jgi:hypothetical protein
MYNNDQLTTFAIILDYTIHSVHVAISINIKVHIKRSHAPCCDCSVVHRDELSNTLHTNMLKIMALTRPVVM